jgi:hypothetical protein
LGKEKVKDAYLGLQIGGGGGKKSVLSSKEQGLRIEKGKMNRG